MNYVRIFEIFIRFDIRPSTLNTSKLVWSQYLLTIFVELLFSLEAMISLIIPELKWEVYSMRLFTAGPVNNENRTLDRRYFACLLRSVSLCANQLSTALNTCSSESMFNSLLKKCFLYKLCPIPKSC